MSALRVGSLALCFLLVFPETRVRFTTSMCVRLLMLATFFDTALCITHAPLFHAAVLEWGNPRVPL